MNDTKSWNLEMLYRLEPQLREIEAHDKRGICVGWLPLKPPSAGGGSFPGGGL